MVQVSKNKDKFDIEITGNAVWKKDIFWGNPFADQHVIGDLRELLPLINIL
ncbi:hypothetical protein D3C84_1307490 [compost metagenome]